MVWRQHDLRRKGPGISLRTYFNAQTLSWIGSADICLPNEKFCCLTSLAVFVFRYTGDPDLELFVASGNTRWQNDQKLSRSFSESLPRSWESCEETYRSSIFDIRIIFAASSLVLFNFYPIILSH